MRRAIFIWHLLFCDLCEDGRTCEERSSSGTFFSAIFEKTEERAKSKFHLAFDSGPL